MYGMSLIYSVFLWRKGFRMDNRVNYTLLAVGAAIHTFAMFKRGFSLSHCPVNNLYEAIIFADWTIVATYLLIGSWARLRFLGAFASPIVFALGVFALMPGLETTGPNPHIISIWTSVHAGLVLLAYGAFGIGSVAALMFLVQEHDLKFHKMRAVLSLMPPIQRLDRVTGQSLLVGFIMLTAGLVVGAIYLSRADAGNSRLDPKVIWSILVWIGYLGLLLMRWKFNQSGRRFAWGALCSFLFVMLTFWGINMLSPIHH